MVIFSKLLNVPMSFLKMHYIIKKVKGMNVNKALDIFSNNKKKSILYVNFILKSAIASAENNYNIDIDKLYILDMNIVQGSTIKRFSARAKGRGDRILKRTSHIFIKICNDKK